MTDEERAAQKQASRARDQARIDRGEVTAREMNRANSFGASVAHLYRPLPKRVSR